MTTLPTGSDTVSTMSTDRDAQTCVRAAMGKL